MAENKLLEKLQRLYKLAILNENEENDESRQNEARTAAFLLIKTARENGVRIRFEVPQQKQSAPPQGFYDQVRAAQAAKQAGFDITDLFSEMMKQAAEDARKRTAQQAKAAGVYYDTDTPFVRPERKPPKQRSRAPSKSGKPPLIEAVHAGRCKVCNTNVYPGLKVWWVRNVGVAHEECGYEELVRISGEPGRL